MKLKKIPSSPDAPGLDPPPGVTSYFDGPFTLQPYLAVEVAVCVILTTSLVAARMYTKWRVMKNIILEDYSCLIGWMAFIAFMGVQYSCGRRGQGTHQWNVPYRDAQYNWKMSNYGNMLYSISILSTKLSIMLIIKRIFCASGRRNVSTGGFNISYYIVWALIVLNTGFYICFIVVPAAACIPREKIWNPEKKGVCVDETKLYIASGAFNLFSDIGMLAVPIYLVWNLQMSIRRKIGISAIFCTGGLACIAAIGRIIYNNILSHTKDYTYTHAQPIMWSIAEIAFGLICSCLVVLPRLYQHFVDTVDPYPSRNRHTSGTSKRLRGSDSSTQHSHGTHHSPSAPTHPRAYPHSAADEEKTPHYYFPGNADNSYLTTNEPVPVATLVPRDSGLRPADAKFESEGRMKACKRMGIGGMDVGVGRAGGREAGRKPLPPSPDVKGRDEDLFERAEGGDV